MATITAAWKITLALGSLIWGSSLLMAFRIRLLDIDFGSAPTGFKNTMYGLSCVALLIFCGKGIMLILHSIEELRAKKIKNNYMKQKMSDKNKEHLNNNKK